MTRHTEGPWDMIPPDSNFPSRTISGPDSEGARYRPLARVFEYDGLPNRTTQLTITPDEADANAQLILTSPKMFEALELAEATILRVTSSCPAKRDSVQGTLDVIRAAIKQAKGD